MTPDTPPIALRYKIYSKQQKFLDCRALVNAFVAGYGSGKTEAGALWALERSAKYPLVSDFIGANTYDQLSQFTMPKFLARLNAANIRYVYNKQPPPGWPVPFTFPSYEHILTLQNGKYWLCRSLDQWRHIAGGEFGGCWIDETRDTEHGAFLLLMSRLRGSNKYPDMPYQICITTTPNGFDWVYRVLCDKTAPEYVPESRFVRACTSDNPFLDAGYVLRLRAGRSALQLKQDERGEFTALTTGRCFEFERERNANAALQYNPKKPLIYSMDFNVSPLCAIVAQDDDRERSVNVLDEIFIPDEGQTREACREFARRWADVKDPETGATPIVQITGDVAGKHRDTRHEGNDITIIQDELARHFRRVEDIFPGGHGLVYDGVQAVNALLNPASGAQPRLKVDPKCDYLIRDLEQVTWKPGTREINKEANVSLSHLADALRYICEQLYPLEVEHAQAPERPRYNVPQSAGLF